MKRKFAITLALVLSLSLGCTACSSTGESSGASGSGTSASNAPSFNLKLAGIKTEDDPATQAMNRFAEILDQNRT